MPIKIAIQGIKGCFHEIAAFKYFGERQRLILNECHSFEEMFRQFEKDQELYGVMAIENTVAGSILPNYSKLMQSNMQIIGEVYLRIEQNLLGIDLVDIASLKEVHSHPMAILQCLQFFKQYPSIKLIEKEDTALSAKVLLEKQDKQIGAIASSLAADHYDLKILAKGIETNHRNFTRFLILQNKDLLKLDEGFVNKASVCFKVGHTPGSLAKVLTIIAEHELNLTKIQSLPVIGREWEYLFLADLEFSSYGEYQKCLEIINPFLNEFQLLGLYQKGIKFRTI